MLLRTTLGSMLRILASTAFAYALIKPIPVYSDNQTWIENLAVRRSNGYILPATATSGILYQVDPTSGEHRLVHDFSKYGNAIMSIADVGSDLFLVNTMNCDIYRLSCEAGSGMTWRVDLREPHSRNESTRVSKELSAMTARVQQISKGPDPRSLLNGAAALNDHIVLMVDQALGGVWAVDIFEGNPKLVISGASMNDSSSQGNGVNGIRIRGGTLYFNNPSKGTFARIPIDPTTGQKNGIAKIIKSGLSPDDFEIDEQNGVAYLTNGDSGELLKISLKNGTTAPVVTGLAGPTTARWKEYGKSLYVATTGGYEQWLSGNATVPAVVYQVDV